MSVLTITQDAAEFTLALGVLTGRIDAAQLARLDVDERRAWGRKLAAQFTADVADWAPPMSAPADGEVPGLVDELHYRGQPRDWVRACNAFLVARHEGRLAQLPVGVDRQWLHEHHPAVSAIVEASDPWGSSPAFRAGAAEPSGDRAAGGLDAE